MIPLCHKCASVITTFDEIFGCDALTGCKECDIIKTYEDAKEHCPLLEKTDVQP